MRQPISFVITALFLACPVFTGAQTADPPALPKLAAAEAQLDSDANPLGAEDVALTPGKVSEIMIETLETEEALDKEDVREAQESAIARIPDRPRQPERAEPRTSPADSTARFAGLALMVGGIALGLLTLVLLRRKAEG